ncbi:MAG: hypothetical protein D6732_28440 [Methanobacteriota archaeon]|nr:MAG: hypothetical protein D6732_28440 [Euryarchaeota archaeon]
MDASMWLWERAGLRERIAVANSIKPLLAPKSIAVIGASRDEKSIGNKIFRNLISGNFKGTVYPVNQEADSIMGVKAYSKISELPTEIDLAVVSVPADNVNEVVERAIHKGARGIVVVSAGFAEAGDEGIKRQQELVKIIRKHGVRLVGPSCLGVINTSPSVSMNSSLSPTMPPFGKAGFFSHSAALGIVVLNYAKERGIGFTSFVSAGNRADVSGNDLLQYWEEDNQTKFAILYLETFGNPRRFVRIARRMSYKKPILCVKSGRSSAGAFTTKTKYTSSVTALDEVDALFSQTGMIVTDTLEELFDVAAILSSQPLPKGNGVGIIGNSAGMVTLFADAADANELSTTEDNLINLGAFATATDYRKAVSDLYAKESVNSLLIGFAGLGQIEPEEIIQAITEGIKKAGTGEIKDKPVVLCMMGKSQTIVFSKEDKLFSFPTFRFPETAARALGKVAKYSKFVELGAGKLVWFEDVDVKGAREFVTKLLHHSGEEEIIQLGQEDSKSLLQYFGYRYNSTESVSSYRLLITPDPLFGPTIKILQRGKKTIIRITPLTDKDILEILSALELKSDDELGNIIGKLSQMIEEIPWLWQLSMDVIGNKDYTISNIEIELKTKGSNLPQY